MKPLQREAPGSRSAEGRRVFIALGAADPGPRSALPHLSGIANDLHRLHDLFVTRLGYEHVRLARSGAHDLDLAAAYAAGALGEYCAKQSFTDADSVVFYFSGHGINHGSTHYLCMHDFDDQWPASGLETRRLAGLLPQSAGRLWIILDVCRAGDGASALCEAISRDRVLYRGSVWFLAACGRAPSFEQAFSTAFAHTAQRFIARGGCPSHADFARRIQHALGGARAAQQVVPSAYGAHEFDFFGSLSAKQTRFQSVMSKFAPTFGARGAAQRRPRVARGTAPKPRIGRRWRVACVTVALASLVGAQMFHHVTRKGAHERGRSVDSQPPPLPVADVGKRESVPAALAADRVAAMPRAESATQKHKGRLRAVTRRDEPDSLACARILERQSLGESLSRDEAVLFARECDQH